MKKGLGRCCGECAAVDGDFIQVETSTVPADKVPVPQPKDENPQVLASDEACSKYVSVFDTIT